LKQYDRGDFAHKLGSRMKLALTFFIGFGVLSASPVATTNVKLLGPTTLSVNGKSETVMSIDFDDWTDVGSSWKAHLSDVGGNISNTYNPRGAKVYKEEAYLYTQIIDPNISSQTASELQLAAWYLTSNDGWSLKTFLDYGDGSSPFAKQTYNDVAADLRNAAGAIKTMDFTGFKIVSDANRSGYRNEEYIFADPVATPEPATNALLGMSLALAGFGRFLFRRKKGCKA
jgi:hypothetical protein